MATYTETKVARALMLHLGEIGLSPAMTIMYPNVPLTTLPALGYLRASLIPNITDQITLGSSGQNRHVGLMQVDVMWAENQGVVSPLEIAGAIVAHFKRGTVITKDGISVRITKPPYVSPAQQEPPYVQIPVTIEYQFDADNPA